MEDTNGTPEVLARALSLEGKWEADASLKMGEDIFQIKYFFDFRKLPHGQGLYLEETSDIPGVGTLIGANIIGFDPYDGKLHWFTVDNLGTTHDHWGELLHPDHLRLHHESMKDGQVYKETIDFVFMNEVEFSARLIGTLSDQIEEELEGVFKRR